MEFSPPRPATVTSPSGKRGQGRRVPTHVKLVFDIEDDTVVSVLSMDDAQSRSSSRRSGRRSGLKRIPSTASVTSTQANPQATAAKAEADKAIAAAQAAIKKFPPQFKTAHQGDYFMTADSFGNLIPCLLYTSDAADE